MLHVYRSIMSAHKPRLMSLPATANASRPSPRTSRKGRPPPMSRLRSATGWAIYSTNHAEPALIKLIHYRLDSRLSPAITGNAGDGELEACVGRRSGHFGVGVATELDDGAVHAVHCQPSARRNASGKPLTMQAVSRLTCTIRRIAAIRSFGSSNQPLGSLTMPLSLSWVSL